MNVQVARIDISYLNQQEELGSGGQGKVVAVGGLLINGRWPAALKTYSSELTGTANTSVLEEMVRFPQQLDHASSEWLQRNTAWPAMVVEDNGEICGFLMRRVPPEYYFTYLTQSQGGKQKPADVAFLLNPDSYVARSGISVSDRDRIALLGWLADGLSRLHSLGVVVGDLSPKNILFSLAPSPSCFIIDCDAVQLRGQNVLRQLHTPEWEVPATEPALAPASDAYKLGLMAIRLFARDQSARDPVALAGISPQLERLARRSLSHDPGQRPAPAEWIAPLQAAGSSASSAPAMSISHGSLSPSSKRISVSIPTVSAGAAASQVISPPARIRSTARTAGVSAATAGVVAIIVLIVVVVNLLHRPALHASVTGTSSSSSPAGQSASDQAAQIDNLLSSSAASRGSLQPAVNNIGNCSDVPGAVAAISDVASQRKAELAKAEALATGSLPNGSTLKSDLVNALRYSLQADQDFLRWAQDQMNTRCSAPAPLTAAYQAGFSASKAAETAKTAFIQLWNPIATQHGLAARSQNAI